MASSITDALRETPKLAIDKLPVLGSMFEQVSLACIDRLRDYCAAPVTAFVNQLEIKPSWDLLEAFEDSVAVIFHAVEWDVRIVIGMERRFVFALIEAAFGGDGSEKPFETSRGFTNLETRLGRAVCEMAAGVLQTALQPYASVTLNPEKTETALEFTSLGPENIMLLNAQILFQVLENGGRMFVFIPQSALYPIRRQFEQKKTAQAIGADPGWQKKLQDGVAQTAVVVSAVMDAIPMQLVDIVRLHTGQVLELQGTDRTVQIECGGHPIFTGQLGRKDGFLNVTVETSFEPREVWDTGLSHGIPKT